MKKREIDLALKLLQNPEAVLHTLEKDLHQERGVVTDQAPDENMLKELAPELVVEIADSLTAINPNFKKLHQQYAKEYDEPKRDLVTTAQMVTAAYVFLKANWEVVKFILKVMDKSGRLDSLKAKNKDVKALVETLAG